jgi:hypothetical protein
MECREFLKIGGSIQYLPLHSDQDSEGSVLSFVIHVAIRFLFVRRLFLGRHTGSLNDRVFCRFSTAAGNQGSGKHQAREDEQKFAKFHLKIPSIEGNKNTRP